MYAENMTPEPDINRPWTMPLREWTTRTGSDATTYERLVEMAFKRGEFGPGDHDVSGDARWTARRCQNFHSRRVQ